MRRSLGGGGRGMGGGSGMIRNVHRAIRAGVGGAPPDPFSSSSANTTTIAKKPKNLNKKKPNSPNTALSLSSSGVNTDTKKDFGFSSLINFPKSAGDDLDWEYVDGSIEDEEMGINAFYDDFVFGNVPSRDEVQHAVSALQLVLRLPSYTHFSNQKRAEDTSKDESINDPTGFEESQMDWIEPSMNVCNSRILQTDRVYDAFHLLQTEPSVQRMVVSLSSDKAVWDAILNNEVVKELRGSITQDNKLRDEDPNDSNTIEDIIMRWIVVNAKAKLIQLIDQIVKLVNGVFEFPKDEKRGDTKDPLEDKLKASLMLSVVVLLIVVVTRARSG